MVSMTDRQNRRFHTTAFAILLIVLIGSMESRTAIRRTVADIPSAQAVMAMKPVDTPHTHVPGKSSAQPDVRTSDPEQTVEEVMKRIKSNPFPYTEQVEVVATGYYAGLESTGKSPGHPEYGVTYSGVKVRRDTFSTIAADPKVFPIGTVLYIPGYGYGVVTDTGSAIKGNKIDLYFRTKDDIYKQWGKRTVKVNVLMRGNGKVTESMLDKLNAMESVPVDVPASPSM